MYAVTKSTAVLRREIVTKVISFIQYLYFSMFLTKTRARTHMTKFQYKICIFILFVFTC